MMYVEMMREDPKNQSLGMTMTIAWLVMLTIITVTHSHRGS